jgi:hypothetical protein
MKRFNLIFTCLIAFVFISATSQAQTSTPNYFIGKWDVLVKGLPQGDTHMKFNLADSVGHTIGALVDTTAAHKDIPLTKVEQANDTITVYFSTQGYDVSLTLTKKDDDHVTGSLMGMFECTGQRIKQ